MSKFKPNDTAVVKDDFRIPPYNGSQDSGEPTEKPLFFEKNSKYRVIKVRGDKITIECFDFLIELSESLFDKGFIFADKLLDSITNEIDNDYEI